MTKRTYEYVGGGAYVQGVPRRALTAAEWKRFSALIEEQETLIGTQLYKRPAKAARKPSKPLSKDDSSQGDDE